MDNSHDMDTLNKLTSGEFNDLLDRRLSHGSFDLPAFPGEHAYEEFTSLLEGLSRSVFSREGLLSCASLLAKLSRAVISDVQALVVILRALRTKRLLPLDDEGRRLPYIALALAGLVNSPNPATQLETDPRRRRIVWVGRGDEHGGTLSRDAPAATAVQCKAPVVKHSKYRSHSSFGSRKSSMSSRSSLPLSTSLFCAHFRNGCSSCRLPRRSDASSNSNDDPSNLALTKVESGQQQIMDISNTSIKMASLSFADNSDDDVLIFPFIKSTKVDAPLHAAQTARLASTPSVKMQVNANPKRTSTRTPSQRKSDPKATAKNQNQRRMKSEIQSNNRALSLSSSAFNTNANIHALQTKHAEDGCNKQRPYSVYSPPIVVKQAKKRASVSTYVPDRVSTSRTRINVPVKGTNANGCSVVGALFGDQSKDSCAAESTASRGRSSWRP